MRNMMQHAGMLQGNPYDRLMFSVRKIIPFYSGPCMRVQRSSDSTQLDVGFDGSGLLDTSAIISFVGASNGFVKSWYNQNIIGLDATDGGNNTCYIVESGTLVTDLNSLPAIKNTGAVSLGLGVTIDILSPDYPRFLETIYKVENITAQFQSALLGSVVGQVTMYEGSFTRFQTRRGSASYLPTPFPGRNILLLLNLVRTSNAGTGNIKCWGNGLDYGFGDINGEWASAQTTYITNGSNGKVQEIRWSQIAEDDATRIAKMAEINSYFSIY